MLLANWSFIHTTFHGHEIKREERKRRKGEKEREGRRMGGARLPLLHVEEAVITLVRDGKVR